jgi:hypothetical protein
MRARSFGEAGCYFYCNAFTRITGVPGASGEEEARHQCLRLAKVGDDSCRCYAFRGFGQIKLTTNEGDAINLSTSKVVF